MTARWCTACWTSTRAPGTRSIARCRKFLAEDEFADCGDRVETAWWLLEEYEDKIPREKVRHRAIP